MTKEEAKKFGLQLLQGIMERNESYPVYVNNIKQAIEALSEPNGSSEIPKDLEEAARQYFENPENSWEVKEVFIAGANWQKEQYHFFNEAWADNMQYQLDRNYENGKQAMKEQMLKEAVEGKIIFLLNGGVAVNIGDTDEYKLGQKVRIIIVKEN